MVFENHLSMQKNERENIKMTEEQFINSPLDEEEQWYEEHFEEFRPCKNQEEMRAKLQKAAHNTMEIIRTEKRKKKLISINLDDSVTEYFKALAEKTSIPYQNLINMYLLQCVREKKEPVFV